MKIINFKHEDKFVCSFKFITLVSSLIVFSFGIFLCIIGVLLRLSKFVFVFSNLEDTVKELLKKEFAKNAGYVILFLGILFIITSCIGIYGIFGLNRKYLKVQLIFLSSLLLCHVISIIFILMSFPLIKSKIKEFTDRIMYNLNGISQVKNLDLLIDNNEHINEENFKHLVEIKLIYTSNCEAMNVLSSFFSCCGSNSYRDFSNNNMTTKCCAFETSMELFTIGCNEAMLNLVKQMSSRVLILPNLAILTIEAINVVSMICCVIILNKKQMYTEVALG